jgi:glyoxylase-like metal-dependent hydrolase (beta-lactamase superfamily II)
MRFGPYEASIVRDGQYRLDGGSMFGVVPKVLWARHHSPDDRNRIALALNCLLLQGEGRVVLVDNGRGDGWSDKDLDIYGLERPQGDVLMDLQRRGIRPEEVTDVVLTHLHFDHAGGTVRVGAGEPQLTFPRATHWLQAQNLRWGESPTERDRRSYLRPKWARLLDEHRDQVRLVEGPQEILPGVETLVVNGHTPGQQLVLVGDEQQRLLFCGDLVPFASHLRIPWIMAFDLNPLLTLAEKRETLARAAIEGWVLAFQHDPSIEACTVRADDGHYEVSERVTL